jgi:hypothetical protein
MKEQSRKDNPETLVALGTQDTGGRQKKKNHNPTQKVKKMDIVYKQTDLCYNWNWIF